MFRGVIKNYIVSKTLFLVRENPLVKKKDLTYMVVRKMPPKKRSKIHIEPKPILKSGSLEREIYCRFDMHRKGSIESAINYVSYLTRESFKSLLSACRRVDEATLKILRSTVTAYKACMINTPGCLIKPDAKGFTDIHGILGAIVSKTYDGRANKYDEKDNDVFQDRILEGINLIQLVFTLDELECYYARDDGIIIDIDPTSDNYSDVLEKRMGAIDKVKGENSLTIVQKSLSQREKNEKDGSGGISLKKTKEQILASYAELRKLAKSSASNRK